MLKDVAVVAPQSAAVAAILAQWRARWPRCGALLFLPEAERAQVPALQAAFREQAVPMLGAIFPALVVGARFVTEGAVLVALEPMPPSFLLDALGTDSHSAQSRISSAIRDLLTTPAAKAGAGPATMFHNAAVVCV